MAKNTYEHTTLKSNDNNDQQMTFDQFPFQTPNLNFEEKKSSANYSYALIQNEEDSKTRQFIGLSAAIHVGLIILASIIAIPLIEKNNVETISFEIAETPQPLPPAPAVVDKAPPVVLPPTPKASPVSVAKTVVAKPAAKAPQAKVSKTSQATSIAKPVVTESPVVVPQTIDDIKAPSLDESAMQNTAEDTMDENDIADDLQKVDQKNNAQIAQAQQKMDQQLAALEKENSQAVSAALKKEADEKARMAALNSARREQDAANIAAAQSAERASAAKQAAAAKAAREAAAAAAKAAEEAKAAKAAAAASASKGTTGDIPAEQIRQLADLKQIPGNPQPQYDQNERLKGHQGNAVFLAYITREGRTSQFRLAQSTGYRNLDSKTLAALKKWKFYPGQEGWVEMPFEWSLKGGVEEKPALLRRAKN